MSNTPTPPTFEPESNGIDNVAPSRDGHSPYWGMDEHETAASYIKRLRSIKVRAIVLLIVDFAVMMRFLWTGRYGVYMVGLVLLFVITVGARARMGRLFRELGELISMDCDPARYRVVLDAISDRDFIGRSTHTIDIERAYCDYLELDSATALRRLESISFKRKGNPRWFRAMQIEFLSRLDQGDVQGARVALDRLSAFRLNFSEGSRNRSTADAQVSDYTVLLRAPGERDTADAARMRERMALADCHQQRANWQLLLAEYELLHGSSEEAERLAADASLDPLTPRMERMRSEVLRHLGSRSLN